MIICLQALAYLVVSVSIAKRRHNRDNNDDDRNENNCFSLIIDIRRKPQNHKIFDKFLIKIVTCNV